MNSTIELKPVKDLLGMSFEIPAYQRGYRWGDQQLVDLLDDITNFAYKQRSVEDSDAIYCVQPLVVSRACNEEQILTECKNASSVSQIREILNGSNKWKVVDGQQRLTTIYLILRSLDKEIEEQKNSHLYKILYETRENSQDFLQNITDQKEEDAKENIDFYHMYNAFKKINDWINTEEKTQSNLKETLKNTLLNKVNFIWYEVPPEEEISVFTRLNVGKIPLTDSELIKALFLNSSFYNFNAISKHEVDALLLKIASEWDYIEYSLQNDEFWSFIYFGEYTRPTRIDFILDLININSKEDSTFRFFYEKIKTSSHSDDASQAIRVLWKKVKDFYQILDEWYNDYKLYHYIGFLSFIHKNDKTFIKNLIDDWVNIKKKDAFVNKIKTKIGDYLSGYLSNLEDTNNGLDKLHEYQFDTKGNKKKTDCIGILLLHNIETIVKQNEKLIEETKYGLPNFTKFPFHLFQREKWQVEHIRPNAGSRLDNVKEQKLYLALAKKYLNQDAQLAEQIDTFLNDGKSGDENKNKVDFENIFNSLSTLEIGDNEVNENNKNCISNFVLLDATTNKEYGNQIFPVKRAFIINKEKGIKISYSYSSTSTERLTATNPQKEVAFIPPCTKFVFSKQYTQMPSSMLNWNEEDAENYFKDIKDKLQPFLDSADNQSNMER